MPSDHSSERNQPDNAQTFCEGVTPLLHEIGRTLCIALDQGHAAVCIVTARSRALLEQQLSDRGIDADALRQRGQYVVADAAETLQRIAPEGADPEARRFNAAIGDVVEPLARTYSRVWMYGELAALMRMQDRHDGALRVERIWTAFAKAHPACLCVAFPVAALSQPLLEDTIRDVIAQQIRILAQDSAMALAVRPPAGRR